MHNQTKEKLNIIKVKLTSEHVYGEEAEITLTNCSLESTIENALALKEFLGHDWMYQPGKFPNNFENYTSGWNASQEELHRNKENRSLFFLNLDLEDNGCTRRCSHCFTMDGQIDIERGRKKTKLGDKFSQKKLSIELLVDQIKIAKDQLGLKAVRILGRGEPTESVHLLSFVEEMYRIGVQVVIFTRGHVIGNDVHARLVYGKVGITSGEELAQKLYDLNASIIIGYSALNDQIHDGMVGIKGHSKQSRLGLKRLMDVGFHKHNPTRLGIEAPIAKLNMAEFPVSYILFQCLGISPVYNAYMVTGRSDEEFFYKHTPSLEERVLLHGQIQVIMAHLGIESDIGAYLGTKECHDVEHGLYIPSTGLIRPCPGFEGNDTIRGDLKTDDICNVWRGSRITRKQHVCEPKIAHGFPLDYVKRVSASTISEYENMENLCSKIVSSFRFGG